MILLLPSIFDVRGTKVMVFPIFTLTDWTLTFKGSKSGLARSTLSIRACDGALKVQPTLMWKQFDMSALPSLEELIA